jgi:hypothetical protein
MQEALSVRTTVLEVLPVRYVLLDGWTHPSSKKSKFGAEARSSSQRNFLQRFLREMTTAPPVFDCLEQP